MRSGDARTATGCAPRGARHLRNERPRSVSPSRLGLAPRDRAGGSSSVVEVPLEHQKMTLEELEARHRERKRGCRCAQGVKGKSGELGAGQAFEGVQRKCANESRSQELVEHVCAVAVFAAENERTRREDPTHQGGVRSSDRDEQKGAEQQRQGGKAKDLHRLGEVGEPPGTRRQPQHDDQTKASDEGGSRSHASEERSVADDHRQEPPD